ncbi:GNAT family N-acetyltransferase [uncultured Tateyamaria sp.]|uniref:GNAT family N-acetyltransferase n=1 Tax=Tateyamaria sp. 1078 TaxID=3417464 RepID=UPI00260886D3|nr:GNAT family N-acetyltransferase [uncultured Tateyamaria sp.]
MSNVRLRSATAADMDAVARLCWAYRALLAERSTHIPGIVERYYSADSYAQMIAALPQTHARPKGDIILAEHDGAVIGCAMYYPLGPNGVTEIKRVFVDPDARGLGAGRALMQEGIRRASADGYRRMVLDTIAPLHEAVSLYEALGFRPCAPYYEPEPAYVPHLRFFDIALQAPA